MLVPELEALRPIDPTITNSDDYEIFVLSSARVVNEQNGKLVSLLTAYADTQLRIEGRLEPLARGQSKCRTFFSRVAMHRYPVHKYLFSLQEARPR